MKKQSKNMLTLAALFSAMLVFNSCKEGKKSTPGTDYPERFKTTYRLEINGGSSSKVLEGVSVSDDGNQFHTYPQHNNVRVIFLQVDGEEDRDELHMIAGTVFMDADEKLIPFGEAISGTEYKTQFTILTDSLFMGTLTSGTQQLTNVKYYTRKNEKARGKVSYRYTFSDLAMRDDLSGKMYSINGFVETIPLD